MDEPGVAQALYPLVYDAVLAHLASGAFGRRSARTLASLDVRLSGWANANAHGASNALHDHADQDWALSGVLFLDDGADDTCALALQSPLPPTAARAAAQGHPLGGPAAISPVPPEPGLSIVFPSWLGHWVPRHCGDRTRLSVAFNAAALLPGRVWPDGQPSKPAPGLAKAMKQRAQAKVEAHALWPLSLTVAHVPPSVDTERAWEHLTAGAAGGTAAGGTAAGGTAEAATCLATVGGTVSRCCITVGKAVPPSVPAAADAPSRARPQAVEADSGCTSCDDTRSDVAAVLRPIGAALRHALTRNESGEIGTGPVRTYEVRACALSPNRRLDTSTATDSLFAHAAHRSDPVALGAYLLDHSDAAPADGESRRQEACAPARRLWLPDPRTAAGDLATHVSAHRRGLDGHTSNDASNVSVADGTIFAIPAWARALIIEQPARCAARRDRETRAVFFRAAAMPETEL